MRRYILVLISSLFLMGCVRYSPKASKPLSLYLKQVNAEISTDTWLSHYHAMPEAQPADIAAKQAERNRILGEFIFVQSDAYEKFKVQLYTGRALKDMGADAAQIGTSAATALSLVQSTQKILGVAGTVVAGENLSVDKRWYDTQNRVAIVAEMDALRSQRLKMIHEGMGKSLAEYPLERGINDVKRVEIEGSLVEALQAIAASASTQAVAAKEADEATPQR